MESSRASSFAVHVLFRVAAWQLFGAVDGWRVGLEFWVWWTACFVVCAFAFCRAAAFVQPLRAALSPACVGSLLSASGQGVVAQPRVHRKQSIRKIYKYSYGLATPAVEGRSSTCVWACSKNKKKGCGLHALPEVGRRITFCESSYTLESAPALPGEHGVGISSSTVSGPRKQLQFFQRTSESAPAPSADLGISSSCCSGPRNQPQLLQWTSESAPASSAERKAYCGCVC